MKRTSLLVALTLVVGMLVAPAAGVVAQEPEPDDDVGADDRDADSGPGNADGVGPSDGLPDQAPDHVSEIHDRIDSFLSGSVDDLGESLGELLGDDASEGTAVEHSE